MGPETLPRGKVTNFSVSSWIRIQNPDTGFPGSYSYTYYVLVFSFQKDIYSIKKTFKCHTRRKHVFFYKIFSKSTIYFMRKSDALKKYWPHCLVLSIFDIKWSCAVFWLSCKFYMVYRKIPSKFHFQLFYFQRKIVSVGHAKAKNWLQQSILKCHAYGKYCKHDMFLLSAHMGIQENQAYILSAVCQTHKINMKTCHPI